MAETGIDVFISYSRSDARFVDRLDAGLKALGFTTWVDRGKLEGGQNWEREVQSAIDRSRAMIVVLSPPAAQSVYVQAEYSYGLDKKKAIVPLLYRPCEVPLRLRIFQFVTFTGSQEALLGDLQKALRLHGIVPSPTETPSGGETATAANVPSPWPWPAALPRALPRRARLLVPLSAMLLVVLAFTGVLANGILHPRSGGPSTGGPSATHTEAVNHVKVGLVTDIGGLNDNGFNALAYQGLQQARSALGSQVDVKVSQNSTDYVPNLSSFASEGYDLVIAVGFLMQSAVGTVAAQYPTTHFALVDGYGTDDNGNDLHQSNVMDLLFREQDAGAMVGVIAGMLERTGRTPRRSNIISAVGGVTIPPVDHYIAGYQWGAKLEDPSISVQIGYAGTFSDQASCLNTANSQIANGSEIVFVVAGGCGVGGLQAAGERGVYSIGVDTDEKAVNASVIASAVKKVDVAVYFAIIAVAQQTFRGGEQLFGLDNGGVGYAPGNLTLGQDIIAEMERVSKQIISGTLTVPSSL